MSGNGHRKRILFTGYAPVHFVCFLPIYQRLRDDPRIELTLSGGFRREDDAGAVHDIDGFYDPFPVDPGHVAPFERVRNQDFDVVVCAHTSGGLFPRSAGRKVQIFHGVSFKNLAVREKVLCFDILCIPGAYHAERFREQGLIRPGGSRALLSGFPKADRLIDPVSDRREFLQRAGVDPSLPTVLYAPTGGKNNSLETMGQEVIESISSQGRLNLLIKPHDHTKNKIDWFQVLAPLENERVRLVRDLDVVDYLRVSDLLLTDASSVAVEYSLLDRPIVFLDVPKLLKKVLDLGAPLDLTTYGRRIGSLVKTPSEVVPAIQGALSDPGREGELRRAMARHVFHEPGRAVERVTNVVLHSAGLLPRLPADLKTITPP